MYYPDNPELFSVFLEHTPTAVAMCDREMRYLLTSRRWLTEYGLENQNLIGHSHYEVFPLFQDQNKSKSAVVQRWQAIQQRCLAGAIAETEQDCFVKPDGTTICVQWKVHPWRNQTGEIGGLILFTEAIPEPLQPPAAVPELLPATSTRISGQRTKTSSTTAKITPSNPQINVFGLNVEWHPQQGCMLDTLPVVMMWIDTTLASFMAALQAMVGTERFILALQSEGRKSIEADWQVISQFKDFHQGFKAIHAVAWVSGWGDWEILSLDCEQKQGCFRIKNSWEGRYQKALGVCWGSAMVAGKLAGYCSRLFKTNCWAEQTAFIANGDQYDEFLVRPSKRSIEEEIDKLLITDEGTRADMAVALQKLRQEIAERKRTEEALRQSEARNRAFLEAIPDMMFRVSKEGIFRDFRVPPEVELNSSPPEMVGKSLQEVLPPEVANQAMYYTERSLATGKIQVFEYQILVNDTWRYQESRVVVSGEDEVLAIVRDITERKQAEVALKDSEAREREKAQQLEQTLKELQLTQAQLVQSEKMSSLGQLVAGVAHEINNPVNFIYGNLSHAIDYTQDLLGLVQLYQQHYPQPVSEIQTEIDAIELDFLSEDLPKLMSSMEVGADRILEIVQSLRNFSRHDEAEVKAVDIHEGLDSTLMILQNRIKVKSDAPAIEVIKEYGNLPKVECYPGQLNQVFMNILTNAIDALEEARIAKELNQPVDRKQPINLKLPNPQICIRTEVLNSVQSVDASTENQVQTQSAPWIAIHIIDNGPGISEEVHGRLFDPFFTTKPVGKGTGIGLSISYQIIVEKHKGHLHCFSQVGKGTEFVIKIPICHP